METTLDPGIGLAFFLGCDAETLLRKAAIAEGLPHRFVRCYTHPFNENNIREKSTVNVPKHERK